MPLENSPCQIIIIAVTFFIIYGRSDKGFKFYFEKYTFFLKINIIKILK